MDLMDPERETTDSSQMTIQVKEEQISLPITKETFAAVYEALYSIKTWWRE